MNYWQSFYKNVRLHKKIDYPSQFAIFCIGEKDSSSNLIEFGCGNGRDAYFFSKYYKKIYAFDKSKFAIDYNKKKFYKCKNLHFHKYDINDKFDFSYIKNKKKTIYARFFLHTLTNEEIIIFIKLCGYLLNKNERVFCEYRTYKDKSKKKVFKKHFRNYLKPHIISNLFKLEKIQKIYQTEGQGYAKYKKEDAYVARQIFIKK